ncbi:MAG TPA: DUF1684 domain-containing protein [Bacteroidota bacterium]|nr:DUF1684 domain-containing protein [Bacteroidota bacterium]
MFTTHEDSSMKRPDDAPGGAGAFYGPASRTGPGPIAGPIAAALVVPLVAALIASCAPRRTPVDPVLYKKEIREWQEKRLKGLTTDTGWLTLAGLGWLTGGENRVGGDSANEVVTPPGKAPAYLGSIFLRDGRATFIAAPGVAVTSDGRPVTRLALESDESAEPTILRYGTLSLYVISRGGKYGVRIKDTENPARTHFAGLEFFPIDQKYRVEATFIPYTPPKILEIPTQAGTVERDSCPGALEFELDGTGYRLDAVIEQGTEDKLFIMFADATSGVETYAPGRQMYTPLPDSANRVILDFNRAYNWPCVFTVFATCPLPPDQNRLPCRVEAGEKMYHGPDH